MRRTLLLATIVMSVQGAEAATVVARPGRAVARPVRKAQPRIARNWLVKKRKAMAQRGVDSRHLPRVFWQGKPGTRTPNGSYLLHGIAETPLGMMQAVEHYLQYGNVMVDLLGRHGISETELLIADRTEWYDTPRQGLLFGKEYIADDWTMAGFSVGGSLGLIQQLRAALAGRDSELVRLVVLHSPVILRGKGLSDALKTKKKNLADWKLENPNLPDHEWLGYYMGAESEFAMRAPMSLFHELNQIAVDNRQHLKPYPTNPAIQALVEADTKIAAYMARRDSMLNFVGTMKFVHAVAAAGGDILTYSTADRMRHDDTVRVTPKTRPGDITIERFDRGLTTELTMTRETAIAAFVDDAWAMLRNSSR